jgi:hypothetical protein
MTSSTAGVGMVDMGALAGAPAEAGPIPRRLLRTELADQGEGAPDFQRAVKLVTGQDIDVRGPAAPAGGWLSLGIPVGGAGWGYYTADALFFGVSRNEKARADWRSAASVYENIDHEVFTGRFGLMDVQRLRDAEQVTGDRVDRLDATLDQIKVMTHKIVHGDLAGTAASMLAAKLRETGQYVQTQLDVLTEPAPAVPDVLHGAAEALAECGRQLSYVWWESNHILLNAPDCEIDAVRCNIDRYLCMNGLGGTCDIVTTMGPPQAAPAVPNEPPRAAPPDPVVTGRIRQVLARYDSTVAGGLPPEMGPITGDLTEQPVWDAMNAAITKRITAELDKLDRVARSQIQKLRTRYEVAAERLAGLGQQPADQTPAATLRTSVAS